MRRLLSILLVITTAGPLCLSEQLSIRVLNAKDGSPVNKVPIWIYGRKADKLKGPLEVSTGADGLAKISLPAEWNTRVIISTEVSGKIRSCSRAEFTIESLKHGVVAAPTDGKCLSATKFVPKITAKPNEVILFIRFMSRWEQCSGSDWGSREKVFIGDRSEPHLGNSD